MINDPQIHESSVSKINKVEAIGKFLTKMRKASNYNQSLIEDLAKYNLKNYREDLANSITEALTAKFDLMMMVKVTSAKKVLAAIWVWYPDDEYRAGLFNTLDKFLIDRKYLICYQV